MPERSALNQVVQIGVESTRGTSVASRRRLQSIGIEPTPDVEMDQFRPMGQKYRAITTLGKEWTTASITGRGSYTELVYLLASVVDTPVITTPASATLARLWTFTPDSFGDDDPKTFTIESGSAVRAHRFTYGIVTEIGMTFNRTSIEVTGSMMGRAITDGITLTGPRSVTDGVTNSTTTVTSATAAFVAGDVGALITGAGIPAGATIVTINSVTSVIISAAATATATGVALVINAIRTIALIPIIPTQVSVFIDNTAAALGTTKMTRAISAEFSLGSRFGGVWVLDAANSSFVNHIETEPDLTMSMTLQADAQGMALLEDLRDGDTKFIRIEATGTLIESGQPYLFQLDLAGKVADTNGFSDEDGVYAVEFSFVGVHDAVWNKAYEFRLRNALTAL